MKNDGFVVEPCREFEKLDHLPSRPPPQLTTLVMRKNKLFLTSFSVPGGKKTFHRVRHMKFGGFRKWKIIHQNTGKGREVEVTKVLIPQSSHVLLCVKSSKNHRIMLSWICRKIFYFLLVVVSRLSLGTWNEAINSIFYLSFFDRRSNHAV